LVVLLELLFVVELLDISKPQLFGLILLAGLLIEVYELSDVLEVVFLLLDLHASLILGLR
jgi:hypothetical protein